MGEIIKVDFSNGRYKYVVREGLIQWDIGTKLEIHGLELEEDTQVHFSLQQNSGLAKRMLGKWADGILTVDIPAFILEGEEECCYCWNNEYHAWAWIYVTEGELAETVKKIELHIESRAKPDEYSSPGDKDIIQQLREDVGSKVSKEGHSPNKYLGTDEEGKVVEKDAPEGTGGSKYGIPAGGTKGQYLRKVSDEDYDVAWSDLEIPEQYGLVTYNQDKTLTIT